MPLVIQGFVNVAASVSVKRVASVSGLFKNTNLIIQPFYEDFMKKNYKQFSKSSKMAVIFPMKGHKLQCNQI